MSDIYNDVDRNSVQYTPEQRMPKLYPRKHTDTMPGMFQKSGWIYEVKDATLDYISKLDKDERDSVFFLKAVVSEKYGGWYVKVLKLDKLTLDEVLDLLHDEKALLMHIKEDVNDG